MIITDAKKYYFTSILINIYKQFLFIKKKFYYIFTDNFVLFTFFCSFFFQLKIINKKYQK